MHQECGLVSVNVDFLLLSDASSPHTHRTEGTQRLSLLTSQCLSLFVEFFMLELIVLPASCSVYNLKTSDHLNPLLSLVQKSSTTAFCP